MHGAMYPQISNAGLEAGDDSVQIGFNEACDRRQPELEIFALTQTWLLLRNLSEVTIYLVINMVYPIQCLD